MVLDISFFREEGLRSFKGRFNALVFGATGGLGAAIAACLLEQENCGRVVCPSRQDGSGFDLTDEASILACAERLVRAHDRFDLIIDATGALRTGEAGPEKALSMLDPENMVQSYVINAVGPAMLLKHFTELMPRAGPCVFATLSALVGSIGDNRLGGWYSYRASKAALNQIVRGAAIEIARKRPEAVCLCLHPGTVKTGLTRDFARSYTHSPEEAARCLLDVIDNATPDKSGSFLAYDGSEIPW